MNSNFRCSALGITSYHVSILKFIERNWNLGTISKRSRDDLPNPTPTKVAVLSQSPSWAFRCLTIFFTKPANKLKLR